MLSGLQQVSEVVQSVDWLWRIATVVMVPLLAWIAVTLRDVDRRLSVVESKVHENVKDIQYNRDQFTKHVDWGIARSQEITESLAMMKASLEMLKESVSILNQHVRKRRTDTE